MTKDDYIPSDEEILAARDVMLKHCGVGDDALVEEILIAAHKARSKNDE